MGDRRLNHPRIGEVVIVYALRQCVGCSDKLRFITQTCLFAIILQGKDNITLFNWKDRTLYEFIGYVARHVLSKGITDADVWHTCGSDV